MLNYVDGHDPRIRNKPKEKKKGRKEGNKKIAKSISAFTNSWSTTPIPDSLPVHQQYCGSLGSPRPVA